MPAEPFPIMRLPLELRESIYAHYYVPDAGGVARDSEGGFFQSYDFDLRLNRVSKQVHAEAMKVFRRQFVFVKVQTPWPTAEYHKRAKDRSMLIVCIAVTHISQEGPVPIVVAGEQAAKFDYHHATVSICAPIHQAEADYSLIILLKDLYLFSRVWFYSTLSYPRLNDHLRVDFTLRSDVQEPEDNKTMSIARQKQMLLPFGEVNGLHEVVVEGYDEDVKQELQRRMAVPHDTVQQCCEKATDLMLEGDRVLAEGNAVEALQLYNQAFHALHILVKDRTRRVLAEVFFQETIATGRYSGQVGYTVRIILRIKLVSRVVGAYLKLQQWEEAAFWGMRSINLMQDAADENFEDFVNKIIGGDAVGAIYLRTGIAFKKMEEGDSEELSLWEDEEGANSRAAWALVGPFLKDKAMVEKEVNEYGIDVEDVWVERKAEDVEG
ncbi:hypothetical protein BDV95DRAFT_537419 [Massariosphaeria phaeospora]|uniref:Uncharacterized protein n=1 Tax=Massariosphaeria phaeospora TaxID=100035 RepID=A0A7C8IFT8_9PLEO|nr:hypothetical protein BDV95DRAFT_537419 [Massariosphaeria phaeospora]